MHLKKFYLCNYMNYELISFIIEVFFIIYINWNIKKKISIAIGIRWITQYIFICIFKKKDEKILMKVFFNKIEWNWLQ